MVQEPTLEPSVEHATHLVTVLNGSNLDHMVRSLLKMVHQACPVSDNFCTPLGLQVKFIIEVRTTIIFAFGGQDTLFDVVNSHLVFR